MKEEQRYAPLLNWIRTVAKMDDTFFVDAPLADLVVALTPGNVYQNGTAIYTLAPTERFLHAYLLRTYLDGVPKKDARAYFEGHRDDISGIAFGYTYSFLPHTCYGCFPDGVIDALSDGYRTLSDATFVAAVKKYPVDYIVWDRKKYPQWNLERFHLPVAASFDDITVFSVR